MLWDSLRCFGIHWLWFWHNSKWRHEITCNGPWLVDALGGIRKPRPDWPILPKLRCKPLSDWLTSSPSDWTELNMAKRLTVPSIQRHKSCQILQIDFWNYQRPFSRIYLNTSAFVEFFRRRVIDGTHGPRLRNRDPKLPAPPTGSGAALPCDVTAFGTPTSFSAPRDHFATTWYWRLFMDWSCRILQDSPDSSEVSWRWEAPARHVTPSDWINLNFICWYQQMSSLIVNLAKWGETNGINGCKWLNPWIKQN